MTEFLDEVSFHLVFISCLNSAILHGSFSHSEEINTKLCDTGCKATSIDKATNVQVQILELISFL